MRKIAFIANGTTPLKKVMIYEENTSSVYLFGYDAVFDCSALFDKWYEMLEDAETECRDQYGIGHEDWIAIADPLAGCQDDFIMPVRIEGRDSGNPHWGKLQTLSDGRWVRLPQIDKSQSLDTLTLKQRLLMSGLTEEFDYAMLTDKKKATKILKALQVDYLARE